MVLKDVECTRCGTQSEALVEGAESAPVLVCKTCDRKRTHRTILGGCLRCITWGCEGIDVNDFIRTEGVKAGIPRPEHIGTALEAKTAKSVEDKAGGEIDKRQTFIADGLRDRREKRDWKRRQGKYGARIVLDGGSR